MQTQFSQRLKLLLLLQLLCILAFAPDVHSYSNEYYGNRWKLTGYKGNYFLWGNPDTKLSLSFKMQAIENFNLYFAYSQLMFWELNKESKPFRDLNYNPEVFYRFELEPRSVHWLDIGAYEHESNGRDAQDSRSWERSYLRYTSRFDLGQKSKLFWSVKAWVAYSDEDNKDMQQYRGCWEVNLTLTDFIGDFVDRNDLNLRLYPGGPSHTDPLKGGQELTFVVNPNLTTRFLPTLALQLFHGYGEGLLDYRSERTMIRVGMGF